MAQKSVSLVIEEQHESMREIGFRPRDTAKGPRAPWPALYSASRS